MEIKKSLKAMDIRISKIATDFGISRPTLDNYIESFEKGQPLSNETFQKVFEYLFSFETMSSIEFAQKYDYVKRVMLQDYKNKNKVMNNSDFKELSTKLHNAIVSGKVDPELQKFMYLFLTHSDSNLVKALYMYFNHANGLTYCNTEKLSEIDKALYSQLAKLFSDYQNNSIVCQGEWLSSFLQKSKLMYDKKNVKVGSEEIIEYIKENISDSSNIDFDFLRELMQKTEETK